MITLLSSKFSLERSGTFEISPRLLLVETWSLYVCSRYSPVFLHLHLDTCQLLYIHIFLGTGSQNTHRPGTHTSMPYQCHTQHTTSSSVRVDNGVNLSICMVQDTYITYPSIDMRQKLCKRIAGQSHYHDCLAQA